MGNARGVQRYVGFVVVIVVVVVDCAFPMLNVWVGKLRSNGYYCKHDEPARFGTTVLGTSFITRHNNITNK